MYIHYGKVCRDFRKSSRWKRCKGDERKVMERNMRGIRGSTIVYFIENGKGVCVDLLKGPWVLEDYGGERNGMDIIRKRKCMCWKLSAVG